MVTFLSHQVCCSNEEEIEASVLDSCRHVLPLDFLEVELGEDVQPVGDLEMSKRVK